MSWQADADTIREALKLAWTHHTRPGEEARCPVCKAERALDALEVRLSLQSAPKREATPPGDAT